MADSTYQIKETAGELEERATFETRKSVLNRITALKLYRLFVESGESNPVEFTANAVGVSASSVEKWLGIYQKSGLEALLAYGGSSKEPRRRPGTKSGSAKRKTALRKQRKNVDFTERVDELVARDGGSSGGTSHSNQPDPDSPESEAGARQSVQRSSSGKRVRDADSGDGASHPATSSSEQDYGASFSSQVSRSKTPSSNAALDNRASETSEPADQSVIDTAGAAATGDAEEQVPGYRQSLSRTARRAGVRARVSRRAISRLRRRKAAGSGGSEQEGQDRNAADSDPKPDVQPPVSAGVAPHSESQTVAAEASSVASLPYRPDRGTDYRPNQKYAASPGHAFANARVLIAEPDDLITDIIRHRLEKQGATVTSAIDGVEVVSRFWSTTFDLVIVAAALPGLDGFEIARWLRDHQTNSGVPILITSWPGNESDLTRAFDAGADDFLRKPFSPAEMVARARRLLERVSGWDPVSPDDESSESERASGDE